jgi:hypothetical protein
VAESSDSIRGFYESKAAEAKIVLEADDLALISDLQATTDDIAALDACLAAEGRMITSKSGTIKSHPALAAVRQHRLARARLAAHIDSRILAAKAGATVPGGGQTGVRGIYTGDGSQNQERNGERGSRRGVGRVARPRAGRGL